MEDNDRIEDLESELENLNETILGNAEEIEYLNHKLDESEQACEDLKKKLEEQQHEIWELQDLTEYLRDKLKESERERGVLVERIRELSTEYIVLYEGQRWRRQDREPAPRKGQRVEIYSPVRNQVELVGDWLVSDGWYWRPLELPEKPENI